jgi:hypothetical protein
MHSQYKNQTLLNEPFDISGDFRNFSNAYYLADFLSAFDPSTGQGKIKYHRFKYFTRQAFNNMLGVLKQVKPIVTLSIGVAMLQTLTHWEAAFGAILCLRIDIGHKFILHFISQTKCIHEILTIFAYFKLCEKGRIFYTGKRSIFRKD